MDFFKAPVFADAKYEDDQTLPLQHLDGLQQLSDPMIDRALNGYFNKTPTVPTVGRPVPIRDDRPYLTEYDRMPDTFQFRGVVQHGVDRKTGFDAQIATDDTATRGAMDLDATKVRKGATAVWHTRRMDNVNNLGNRIETQEQNWVRQEDLFGDSVDLAARSKTLNGASNAAVAMHGRNTMPIRVEQAITTEDKMFPRMAKFMEFVRQRYREFPNHSYSMLASDMLKNDRVIMAIANESSLTPQMMRNALTYVAENTDGTIPTVYRQFLFSLWEVVEHIDKFTGPDSISVVNMPRDHLYMVLRYATNRLKFYEEHKTDEIKNPHVVDAILFEMARTGQIYEKKAYVVMEDRLIKVYNVISGYYKRHHIIPATLRKTIIQHHNIGDFAFRMVMGQIATDLRPQLKEIDDIPLRKEIEKQYRSVAFAPQNRVTVKEIGELPTPSNASRVNIPAMNASQGDRTNLLQVNPEGTTVRAISKHNPQNFAMWKTVSSQSSDTMLGSNNIAPGQMKFTDDMIIEQVQPSWKHGGNAPGFHPM